MAALRDYTMTIREFHLDTFGHVNNATYLALLEEARWEIVTGNGYGLEEVQKHRKGPVILEVNLKFQNELKLREQIKITTQMLGYPGKVGQLKQIIYKQDGTQAAEAVFTFGLFDLASRRLIEPTPEWKKAVGIDEGR